MSDQADASAVGYYVTFSAPLSLVAVLKEALGDALEINADGTGTLTALRDKDGTLRLPEAP